MKDSGPLPAAGLARVTMIGIVTAGLVCAFIWLFLARSSSQAQVSHQRVEAIAPVTEPSVGQYEKASHIEHPEAGLPRLSVVDPEPSMETKADVAIFEAPGAELKDARPVLGRIPFNRNHRIPKVSELVLDPGINPHRIALSADEMAHLQELVAQASANIATSHQEMSRAARSWAKFCVENGQYYAVRAGDQIPGLSPGVYAVGFSDLEKGEDKVVVIRPGECAELDIVAFQQSEMLSSFYATVRKFFSK